MNTGNHELQVAIEHLSQAMDSWVKDLEKYRFTQLRIKPAAGSWSLGQLYMHLATQTAYFIKQVAICLSADENANEKPSDEALKMFQDNSFPDAIIEGPPDNATTLQPESKGQILRHFSALTDEITRIEQLIDQSPFRGKTKHPGLHYFGAGEWLQFADMHLRHHLRQKKRIDDFLKMNAKG